MKAEELLATGDPRGALAALQDQIRANPSDPELRIFLFQLLALTGQWDRASTQLDLVGDMRDTALGMKAVYSDVLNCELHRQAVFAGQAKPLVLGQPSEWMAHLIEAQQALARGDHAQFESLNAQAFEAAPTRSGSIDGEAFEWLADADQRLGPIFEIIFNNHYYWVAQDNIKSIELNEPEDLRDLIWLPAEVNWTNGGQNIVMMPARYPQLDDASDGDLMARHTDWVDNGGIVEGRGQRMWATDASDHSMLQVRHIEFEG